MCRYSAMHIPAFRRRSLQLAAAVCYRKMKPQVSDDGVRKPPIVELRTARVKILFHYS
jgi:hypothetical protein